MLVGVPQVPGVGWWLHLQELPLLLLLLLSSLQAMTMVLQFSLERICKGV